MICYKNVVDVASLLIYFQIKTFHIYLTIMEIKNHQKITHSSKI